MDLNNILIEKCNNNIKLIEINNYSEIKLDLNIPIKYKIKNNNIVEIEKELYDYNLDYSIDGKSDKKIGNIIYKDFLENNDSKKYIFHNILKNQDLFEVIQKYIPLPKDYENVKLRISRFYSGYKYSGSNIHSHSKAINYLCKGIKLWIIFPNTFQNKDLLKKNQLDYMSNIDLPLNCFLKHYDLLNKDVENLCIILQEESDAIFIPDYYFHSVINLDQCHGITYSW